MTTTPNYGGVLPTVGGDSGTWGTENNTLHSLWDTTIFALSTLVSGAQRSMLAGLGLSTAGASASFTVQPGAAADSTNAGVMALAASLTKTTGSWAVGGSAGALDTGAIANSTWYHVYLIKRVDTGVVDVLASLSATAPTLPTNYTLFRRIGSMKTDGAAKWLGFTQNGDEFLWLTPISETATTISSVTPLLVSLAGVPAGVKVNAIVAANTFNGAPSGNYFTLSAPDTGGIAASTNTAQASWTSGTTAGQAEVSVRTNTSAQVYWAVSSATATNYSIYSKGWIDRRGRDA